MPTQQSFWQLLSGHGRASEAVAVAVPLLQRDYAQGRPGPTVATIRQAFVAALRGAFLTTPDGRYQSLGLDFVYGTVAAGTLTPLDGQQRLTTLFLLHWYLATGAASTAGAEVPENEQATLGKFSYEVRAAARDFCAALAACPRRPAPVGSGKLSQAVANAAWFRLAWHRDPTVSGMLVMLDELHAQFQNLPNCAAAWAALTGPAAQAPLTFQFLNLGKHQLTDDLYTRMNARGKPLTGFENWKAWFHAFLHRQYPADTAKTADSFVEKMDGAWTTFFWKNKPTALPQDDPARMVDGPFQAYLDFVTRLLWLRDLPGTAKPDDYAAAVSTSRYEEVYAKPDNLFFLTQSLDLLAGVEGKMADFFGQLLTASNTGDGRVRLFAGWGALSKADDCNLFRVCCQPPATPGLMAEVLFFAVLTYAVRRGELVADTDLRDLLRVLRNRMLRERWIDLYDVRWHEAPHEYIGRYLKTLAFLLPLNKPVQNAYELLATPDCLSEGAGLLFERVKALLQFAQPYKQRFAWKTALNMLEDNSALRGVVDNFDLHTDAKQLASLSTSVTNIWSDKADDDTQALIIRAGLTIEDYAVEDRNGRWFFGGQHHWGRNGWSAVLTAEGGMNRERVRKWLKAFLGAFRQVNGNLDERLQALIDAADKAPDPEWPLWRRHFIRYPEMVLCPDRQNGRRGYFDWRSDWQLQLLPKERVSGYHINPYYQATAQKINNLHLCKVENCFGKGWAGDGALRYESQAGVEGIKLRMEESGWCLELPDSPKLAGKLPDLLRPDFEVTPGEKDRQWRIRPLHDEWDLVKTGVAISEAIAKAMNAAHPPETA